MSREKQIEEIARDFNKGMCSDRESVESCIDCVGASEECLLYGMIATRIYNAGYRKQEWISVEERLPEDGVWVLGYSTKSGRGGLCNCLKSYVREFGDYDDTTHWLPLPEFPKKGE